MLQQCGKYEQLYKKLIHFRKFIQPLKKWSELKTKEKTVGLPKVYVERHHIKPRSIFPKLKDDKDNVVNLLIHEHLLAHIYLVKWYEELYGKESREYKCMLSAFEFTFPKCNIQNISQEVIQEIANLRIELAKVKAEKLRQWNLSEEGRQIHKKAMQSETARRNMSISRKGKPLSNQNKEGIKKAWSDKSRKLEQSERLKRIYQETDFRQTISEAGKKRYSNTLERDKTRQQQLEYYKTHPEARQKHSEDLKDRIFIYKDGKRRRIKASDANKYKLEGWLIKGIEISRVISRGANKGKVIIKYVSPYDLHLYLKPRRTKWKPNTNVVWTIKSDSIS